MEFIYGEEIYLIEEKIKEIIQKKEIDPIFIDATISIEEIIEEINTFSFNNDKKLIFIIDHPIINDSKMAKLLIKEFESLDSTIIVNTVVKTINFKKNNILFNWYKINGNIFELKKLDQNELVNFLKNYINKKGGTISNLIIYDIINYLPDDLGIITSELDKILSYNKIIDKTIILNLLTTYEFDDHFAVPNAIIENNYIKLINNYNKKIKMGQSEILIISQIADILTLAATIQAYKNIGNSNYDISQTTGIHPYRIKLISKLLESSSIDKIYHLLKLIFQLEKDIKFGIVDSKIGLDNFIINYIK